MSEFREKTPRCDRCKVQLENHGVVIVDRNEKRYICPTPKGVALGER